MTEQTEQRQEEAEAGGQAMGGKQREGETGHMRPAAGTEWTTI